MGIKSNIYIYINIILKYNKLNRRSFSLTLVILSIMWLFMLNKKTHTDLLSLNCNLLFVFDQTINIQGLESTLIHT